MKIEGTHNWSIHKAVNTQVDKKSLLSNKNELNQLENLYLKKMYKNHLVKAMWKCERPRLQKE